MLPNDRNKLNRIEELKNKLFSKNYQPHIDHRDTFSHPHISDIRDSWEDTKAAEPEEDGNFKEKFFMKTSRFKKFFIFSLVFFGLTIGYASYVFFFARNAVSNDNIDISIIGNTFTAGGDDLSLVIGITNRNNAPLDLVDLVIEYPKGASNSGSSDTEHFRESLGTIAAGSVRNENVKLVLYGEQGSVRDIKVSIEYRVEGSNAIFVKEKPYQVTINSTPLNLLIDAPAIVSPNQNITLNITSTLNSTRPVSKVLLKVDYPVGFQFFSANPEPTMGNNIWDMGSLSPGVDRPITISGKMIDVFDGEQKSFRIYSGEQAGADKSTIGVIYNTLTHTVSVKKPFIEANLAVNGVLQREYSTNSRTPIEGTINWGNNLDTKVNDLEIRAKITGNAFNTKTVAVDQGTYNSTQATIVWDKFSNQQFAEINPGDFGTVNFTIDPIPLVSALGGIINNPVINIEVSITGKQLIAGYEPQELNNSETKIIKVTSDLALTTKALYYSGAFKNTGPIPPQAEKETTYTIVWSVSNSSSNVSKAQVRAVLPTWVRFIGPISPENEDVIFNSTSREVVWNVGSVPKAAGITAQAKSVSFQIALTPLISQVNNLAVIVNDAVLTGHDDFANVNLRVSKGALRTDLSGDTSLPAGGSLVTQSQ